jgi:ectoine hydroxylase-related dioxygenase (phytanoyl-CoA dioxygenase family)
MFKGKSMSTLTDPLDLNVIISDQERRNGTLTIENTRLGVMLLHARGYVILKGAVPDPLVTELRSSFKTIYEENARRLQEGRDYATFIGEGEENVESVFWERKSRFRIFPKLRGPFASPFVVRNPFAEPIIAETLGANYYCKFLSSDTCVQGAIKQAPHRDTNFYNEDNVRGCIVNIPIMHCGLHNGPIEVWPCGSHLWRSEKFFKFNLHPFIQDDVNPAVEEFASYIPSKKIELKPGELLIRDPGMWHRGTPNPTDEPRTMLTSAYSRKDFYFDYGNPLHNLDETLYKELVPRCGSCSRPFLTRAIGATGSCARIWPLVAFPTDGISGLRFASDCDGLTG